MMYLAAHAFLLRVRNGCLPLAVRNGGAGVGPSSGSESILCLSHCGSRLLCRLSSRKNKQHGSVLERTCWCSTRSSGTCPVHVLWPWLAKLPEGARPWGGVCGQTALSGLRRRLEQLGLPDPGSYRLHDFRRGHAQDLLEGGSSLTLILKAGEWKSAAFLRYLQVEELEARAVLEAHMNLSEAEAEFVD